MGLIVFISGALSIFTVIVLQVKTPGKELNGRFWKRLAILVLTAVILIGFPIVVILAASNGRIDILHLRYLAGWADRIAVVCDIAIPFCLIGFPWWLSSNLPWENASEKTQHALPTWLAGFAAAITAVFIFALHFFKGGQLADSNPALVVAACLGTVVLLLPAYAPLARACWQGKLNPEQWWREQSGARTEVWAAIPPVQWWTGRDDRVRQAKTAQDLSDPRFMDSA
jgi:hypothetical protein